MPSFYQSSVVGEELSSEDKNESRKSYSEKKKKRKNPKPKKHKKKHHEEDDGMEAESRGKPSGHPRGVWRRVGSKFIEWYYCILCEKKQDSESDYMEHLRCHGNTRSPACMDCGNYFESMVDYENHIGNLTKEFIYKCEEPGCGKAHQSKCRLDCHKRTHAGELMYQCNDCGHKLSSIRSIIGHTRAKHLNENPFQCHMCDKAFPIQSQLTRHSKDHLSPPHYTCEHCGRSFSSRQGYNYHQLHHQGIKPHKCSVCGKAFRNKTDMINHERIHSGDRPFTCELCGKSFVEKGALRKHGVVHTGKKNFVCSNCGKQYGYKCSLDGHLKKCQHDIHASKNSNKPEERRNGRLVVEKGALEKYRVVHTRKKNFVCSNCGKQFGYKCSLDGHLKNCQHAIHASKSSNKPEKRRNARLVVEKGALGKNVAVHTRKKNFVCSNCGKQFGYKCSLDGHLKKCQHDFHVSKNSNKPEKRRNARLRVRFIWGRARTSGHKLTLRC